MSSQAVPVIYILFSFFFSLRGGGPEGFLVWVVHVLYWPTNFFLLLCLVFGFKLIRSKVNFSPCAANANFFSKLFRFKWKLLTEITKVNYHEKNWLSMPVWYGANGTRKMAKVQFLVIGESPAKHRGKLRCYKAVAQFIKQPAYWALSVYTVFLLMLNWKKSFLLLEIKFRGRAKEEAKQQPATWMDFLTRKNNYAKKLYLALYLLTFVKPHSVSWL